MPIKDAKAKKTDSSNRNRQGFQQNGPESAVLEEHPEHGVLLRAMADPTRARPDDILALQHAAGNQAIRRLMQEAAGSKQEAVQRQIEEEEIQTKPLDALESGHDAGQALVQREVADEEEIQTKSADGVIQRAGETIWHENPLYKPRKDLVWHNNPLYKPAEKPAPASSWQAGAAQGGSGQRGQFLGTHPAPPSSWRAGTAPGGSAPRGKFPGSRPAPAEPVAQGRIAIVNAKAHTRLVAAPLATDKKQQAGQIEKSKMQTLYNKGDVVTLAEDDATHVADGQGNVVWYRVHGSTNEYIRAEKVFLGAQPGTEATDEAAGDGFGEKAFALAGWAGEAVASADDRLVDRYRQLAAQDERGTLSDRGATEMSNVTYAEGAAWAGSGLLGMAVALKDFCSDEKSAAERVEAAFNAIASAEGVLGGTAQIISQATEGTTSDVTGAMSSFALGFQEFFAGVANLVKTAKRGVDMIKMIAEQAQGKVRHTGDEWLQAGASLLQGALETLKSAAKTARAIYEAVMSVTGAAQTVTSAASQTLSNFALGFDIAIAATKSVFQGYYLAVSAKQWWLMRGRNKELKAGLAERGFTKEQLQESRSAYKHGEASKSTFEHLIAKNKKAISSKQDQIVNMPATGPQWLLRRRLAKMQSLQTEIDDLEEQNKKYEAQKAESENAMKAREETQKGQAGTDVAGPEGQASAPGMPTRADLAEVELVSELGASNRKRVVRQAIHIGSNLVQIAGSIAAFVSGPGAPAAIGLKAAAAGVETSLPFFRALKQFGRNIAAKNLATAGKKGIAGHIFNADKSTAAKLQARKRHATLILMMVADLNKLVPKAGSPTKEQQDLLKSQMARVEGYIRATGCEPAKLYRANGQPQKQVKILVEELAKREFAG